MALAFAIIGRSILATAQVIVVGNKIKGMAIAVRMPYTLIASEVVRPDL